MRKNNQKKTPIILLAVLLSLCLTVGCGRKDSGSSSDGEPEVMNTTVLKADPADYLATSLIAATEEGLMRPISVIWIPPPLGRKVPMTKGPESV